MSTSQNGEVKLWDTSDRRCLLTLQTTSYTWQTDISPDGNVIARGDGSSLCFHDMTSGICSRLGLSGRAVEASAFSPDSG